MSAKDNFNEAMFGMFGVGKDPAKKAAVTQPEAVPAPAEPAKPAARKAAPAQPASPVQHATTFLAAGTVLEGKLCAKGDVEIAGLFKGELTADGKVTICSDVQSSITAASLHLLGCHLTGDVRATGTVIINENARVTGNIYADELICSGEVKGDLEIQGNVALDEKACVEGNIIVSTMTMAQGAIISGNLTMRTAKKAADKK